MKPTPSQVASPASALAFIFSDPEFREALHAGRVIPKPGSPDETPGVEDTLKLFTVGDEDVRANRIGVSMVIIAALAALKPDTLTQLRNSADNVLTALTAADLLSSFPDAPVNHGATFDKPDGDDPMAALMAELNSVLSGKGGGGVDPLDTAARDAAVNREREREPGGISIPVHREGVFGRTGGGRE